MNSKNNNSKNKKLTNLMKVLLFPIYFLILLCRWIRDKITYSIRLTLSFRYIGIFLWTMFGTALAVILIYGGLKIQTAAQQDFTGIQEILNKTFAISSIQEYSREHGTLLYIDNPDYQTDLTADRGLKEYGSKSGYGIAFNEESTYLFVNRTVSIHGQPDKAVIYTEIRDELIETLFLVKIIGASYLVALFFALIAVALSGRGIFQPIKEMTQTVKDISEQNLNLRINVSGSKNELKELALTFNEMMNRLEDQYNRQKQFVSDASHELRTPIAVIQGYADMLDRWGKNDTEVLQESVTAIRNEAVSMQELIDKLLFLARHDNSTLELQKEEFSLSEMLQEIVRETEIIDTEHKITLEINQEISIVADRARLKQAFRIFLDNALKYTPMNGEITVKAYKDNDLTEVSIKDNGIGMKQEELRHIFDRFYRSDQSRTKAKGGYGLGLAIAKIIVLGHNGKIRVKSKTGEGSEFIIIL